LFILLALTAQIHGSAPKRHVLVAKKRSLAAPPPYDASHECASVVPPPYVAASAHSSHANEERNNLLQVQEHLMQVNENHVKVNAALAADINKLKAEKAQLAAEGDSTLRAYGNQCNHSRRVIQDLRQQNRELQHQISNVGCHNGQLIERIEKDHTRIIELEQRSSVANTVMMQQYIAKQKSLIEALKKNQKKSWWCCGSVPVSDEEQVAPR